MAMIGTFDAFTTARLGIYAAQHGLRVTGNNISNINTAGYTRQRIDQSSFKAGASDMYRSVYDNHVGNGALVTGISQVRDPYLDIRYRNTNSDVGYYDTMLSGLNEIAAILDEVGKGVASNSNDEGDGLLYAQLQGLSSALRELSKNPTKDNDDLVRASAEKLAALFNTYAGKLETLRQNTEDGFQKDLTSVNEILTNIRDLNEAIRDNELCGDNALELRDERNRQIDALSEYMHINVEYTMEDAGAGKMVEKLTISLGNSNPDTSVTTDSSVLIDGLFGTQISVPDKITITKADGTTEEVDNDHYILSLGKLVDQRGREWTKETSASQELTEAELTAMGKVPAQRAVFKTQITGSTGWKEGDVITIGGKDVTIGADGDTNAEITVAKMGDTKEVAALVAKKLNGTVPGYTITAEGDTLVYTATKAGAVDQAAAPAEPAFTTGKDVNGDPTTGDITFGARDEYLGQNAVAPTLPAQNATFQYTIYPTKDGWEDGDHFTIGGADFIIGDGEDITLAQMDDPAELAKVIAEKLKDTVDGYEITAVGRTLVYTATEAKKVDAAPAAYTNAPVTGKDGKEHGIIAIERDEEKAFFGENSQTLPAQITTPNGDGTDTVVSYVQVNGKWNRVTTKVEYSSEVQLDDNDLHGSLQASRELLTEAGEFATKDTVANIDENAAKKRGIPYYQKSLDLLAQKFAAEYNKLNKGTLVDQDGNEVGPLTGTVAELEAMGIPINQVANTAGGFGDGYYVGPDGTFMGTSAHNPCDLSEAKVLATDSIDDAIDKIKQYSPAAKNAKTEQEKLAALTAFMKQHGVSDNNAKNVKITLNKPIQMGGTLFSTCNDNNDPNGITASNISVSHGWSIGSVRIVPKFELLYNGEVQDTTQNTNVNHMLSMIDASLVYDPKALDPDAVGTKLFDGSFNDMFSNINTIRGNDQRIANTKLNTHYTSLIDLDTSRDNVSGVDLNDETMNMMQYQKAYSAACRLMNVIDEALDRLINNTGLAGR